jgi:hypothetical protein
MIWSVSILLRLQPMLFEVMVRRGFIAGSGIHCRSGVSRDVLFVDSKG